MLPNQCKGTDDSAIDCAHLQYADNLCGASGRHLKFLEASSRARFLSGCDDPCVGWTPQGPSGGGGRFCAAPSPATRCSNVRGCPSRSVQHEAALVNLYITCVQGLWTAQARVPQFMCQTDETPGWRLLCDAEHAPKLCSVPSLHIG